MSAFDPRDASARSAALRTRRADIKRELATRQRDVIETFDNAKDTDDPALSGLRVEWFLRALPGIGPTKAHRILDDLGINPRATIGGLRINQRTAFRRELLRLTKRQRGPRSEGLVVVIAGPTAVGKGTVVREVRRRMPEIRMSVSATTRPPRPEEVDGVDYFFVSSEQFDRMVQADELMEWAWVHGTHRYGTPREPVLRQKRAERPFFWKSTCRVRGRSASAVKMPCSSSSLHRVLRLSLSGSNPVVQRTTLRDSVDWPRLWRSSRREMSSTWSSRTTSSTRRPQTS